jgi:hypothetical protein
MHPSWRFLTTVTSPVLVVATVAMAGAIFVLDTLTDIEVAAAVLYVVVVLIAIPFFRDVMFCLCPWGVSGSRW